MMPLFTSCPTLTVRIRSEKARSKTFRQKAGPVDLMISRFEIRPKSGSNVYKRLGGTGIPRAQQATTNTQDRVHFSIRVPFPSPPPINTMC